MARTLKNKANIEKFIECWNIYAGLYYETDGEINCREDAVRTFSEMRVFLGEKSLKLSKSVTVVPDYFPVSTGALYTDYMMGFSLILNNIDMGRIHSVKRHGNRVYLASDEITIGIKVDEYGEEGT